MATNIDPYMVLDYARSRDPDDEYNYIDIEDCAIGQACKANGMRYAFSAAHNIVLECIAHSVTTRGGFGSRVEYGRFGDFADALEKALAEGVEFV